MHPLPLSYLRQVFDKTLSVHAEKICKKLAAKNMFFGVKNIDF